MVRKHKDKEEKHKNEHTQTKKSKKKLAYEQILSSFLVGLIVGAMFFLVLSKGSNVNPQVNPGEYLSKEEAVNKTIEWIKNFFAARGADVKVTLLNSTDEGSVYSFNIELSSSQGTIQQKLYVSKDGKLFFPEAIDITKKIEVPKQEQNKEKPEINKTEKPRVRLFVMSYCPFGLQAIKAMIPVYNLLKDKVDISLNYVIYSHYGEEKECLANGSYCSMHGGYELEEDVRQLCIEKEYGKDKLWEYLDYFTHKCSYENKTCWKKALEETGINESKIQSCVDSEYKAEGKNLIAPQYKLNQQYKVSASPTLIINGVPVSISRSPESFKEAICEAFINPPSECNTNLSNSPTTPGFGGGEGSSSQGQC